MTHLCKRVSYKYLLILALFATIFLNYPTWVAAADFPLTITDGLGRELVIERVPQKIVTLAPSVTENLYALGAGDRVVGVSSYSDYPSEALAKPIVGDAFQVNFEQILLLEPDLIIGDAQLVGTQMSKLEELGFPVFSINPSDLEGVMNALLLLGEVLDTKSEASRVVADMREKIDYVTELTKDIKVRPLVFVEVWDEPLMTCGPGSFMQELIDLAGGENLAADARDPWVEYSVEQVLLRDPEIILLTRPYAEEVLARPAWSGVKAVKQGKIIEVNEDAFVRTTPRLTDALMELAEILHPESF